MAKCPPCGSLNTAKRPTFGMSIGGMTVFPPSSVAFFAYAGWLTGLLMNRIGSQRMAIVELPIGLVFGAMLAGFALMLARSLQLALRHWRQGYTGMDLP